MLRRTVILCLLLLGHVVSVQAQEGGDLLGRVNNLRASLGLPGYALNGALSAAAQSQAQWMAETGAISHNRPDGSGPRTRAVAAGYGTTDVTENIYGGTNASIDSAWAFWVNSPIHYNGMVNPRYQEMGIGVARGQLTTYVLVFGNPGGPAPFSGPPRAASGGGGNAASAPPSYVVGQDAVGNIMHEVQPGDTLGDIALIYGYTWDDIPYMKQINGIEDNRSLEVGSIFLVPPHDGTWTPAPGGEPEITPTPEGEQAQPTATPFPTRTATPQPTRMVVATAHAMPEVIALAVAPPTPTPAGTLVALAAAPDVAAVGGGIISRREGISPALAAALVLQFGLLIVAGVEFTRRWRRRR